MKYYFMRLPHGLPYANSRTEHRTAGWPKSAARMARTDGLPPYGRNWARLSRHYPTGSGPLIALPSSPAGTRPTYGGAGWPNPLFLLSVLLLALPASPPLPFGCRRLVGVKRVGMGGSIRALPGGARVLRTQRAALMLTKSIASWIPRRGISGFGGDSNGQNSFVACTQASVRAEQSRSVHRTGIASLSPPLHIAPAFRTSRDSAHCCIVLRTQPRACVSRSVRNALRAA